MPVRLPLCDPGLAACRLLAGLMLMSCLAACAAGRQETPAAPRAQDSKFAMDADRKWSKLETVPYRGKQDDIHFVDAESGWYGNGSGKIYRTTDGGKTWREQFSQQGVFVRALGFIDRNRGFMGNIGTDYFPGVTATHPLYETRDGGATWNVVPADRITGPVVKGICAIDVLKLRAPGAGVSQERVIVHAAGRVGGPAFLMRSLDGGESWRTIDLNRHAAAILDVKFFDELTGLVFAGSDRDVEKSRALILMTRDGGETWRSVYQSTRPFELTWKASFPTRETGFVTIQNYNPDKAVSKRHIARTTDGGLTWNELELVDDHKIREFGIGFADARVGWVGTNNSGFQTLDGGATWQRVEMGRAVNKIRVLTGKHGMVAYAIGVDVYKLVVPRDGAFP